VCPWFSRALENFLSDASVFVAMTPVHTCPLPLAFLPSTLLIFRRELSLKLTGILDLSWGGWFKIWFGSFLLKLFLPPFTSRFGQSGPYVVCQCKVVFRLVFIDFLLPQVGRPRTGRNEDFVLFSLLACNLVFCCLYLYSGRAIGFLFGVIKYIQLHCINIFY
jgi:hypothetical protein